MLDPYTKWRLVQIRQGELRREKAESWNSRWALPGAAPAYQPRLAAALVGVALMVLGLVWRVAAG